MNETSRPARIAAVVLAAGRSSRFPAHKLLADVDGEPLVRHTVRALRHADLAAIVVVLGHAAAEVRAAVGPDPGRDGAPALSFVENPDWANGSGASIAAGIRSLGADFDAAVIVLADQPTLDPAVIDRVLARWRESGRPVVTADWAGERGPPVLFARAVFPELLALRGDRGARDVVGRDPDRVAVLALGEPFPPDIDTPEDHVRLVPRPPAPDAPARADGSAEERTREAMEQLKQNVGAVIGPAILFAVALLALYFVPRQMPPFSLLTSIEFLSFGFMVGAYGTMVGAGGGFLIVPALLLVYHATPQQAAGTSITVVFLNALSGSTSYARQKRVDYRAGMWFSVATLPGAVIGAYLTRYFSGRFFDIVFGLMLLGIAAMLIIRPTVQEEIAEMVKEEGRLPWWHVQRVLVDRSGTTFQYRYNVWTGVTLSFFVGFISSILGIGGGIIHVPVLIHVMGFPAHIATATSHFILAVSAGAGALSHIALGNVLAGPSVFMGIGVLGGAPLGAHLASELKGSRVIRLLSLALIFVGLRLLLR